MADSIQDYEQEHLNEVIDKIQLAEDAAKKNIVTAKKDVDDINSQFDGIHVNTTSYSGMMDTAMSVRQQQQMLAQREGSWQHAN